MRLKGIRFAGSETLFLKRLETFETRAFESSSLKTGEDSAPPALLSRTTIRLSPYFPSKKIGFKQELIMSQASKSVRHARLAIVNII